SAPIGVAIAGERVLVSVQPGYVASSASVSSHTTASVAGALPLSFCSPVYYTGKGKPRFLIAADLPIQGPVAEAFTVQISDAIRFMLARKGFKAGNYSIGYQACDDASAPDGSWTPAACRRNAHT